MIDSRHVTWVSVPSPPHVVGPVSGCEEGGIPSTGIRPEEVKSRESEEPTGPREPIVSQITPKPMTRRPLSFQSCLRASSSAYSVSRAAQSPPLTPVAAPEGGRTTSPLTASGGRVASPAPRSTSSLSGERSELEAVALRPGSVESVSSVVSSGSDVGHESSAETKPPPLVFSGRAAA